VGRFAFRLHLGAYELIKIGGVFDLIGLHAHNRCPAAFLGNADDLLGRLPESHAQNSRLLVRSYYNFALYDPSWLPICRSAAVSNRP
jgi:hypothetical protein